MVVESCDFSRLDIHVRVLAIQRGTGAKQLWLDTLHFDGVSWSGDGHECPSYVRVLPDRNAESGVINDKQNNNFPGKLNDALSIPKEISPTHQQQTVQWILLYALRRSNCQTVFA